MGIARGCLDSTVTLEPADDRQVLAKRERPRSEAVPKVSDHAPADVVAGAGFEPSVYEIDRPQALAMVFPIRSAAASTSWSATCA